MIKNLVLETLNLITKQGNIYVQSRYSWHEQSAKFFGLKKTDLQVIITQSKDTAKWLKGIT